MIPNSQSWNQGDNSQKLYAHRKASGGAVVLPTYGMFGDGDQNKAPVLYASSGRLIVPDTAIVRSGVLQWHEVKSKSQPSWRRNGGRWEHGCDYFHAVEYRKVQSESGAKVFVVVHEIKSPSDPDNDSLLVDSDNWLLISLDAAFSSGSHRKDWPGGKNSSRRGSRGMGGLLWPRNSMSQVVFSQRV